MTSVSAPRVPPTEHARNRHTHTHTDTDTHARALSLSHTARHLYSHRVKLRCQLPGSHLPSTRATHTEHTMTRTDTHTSPDTDTHARARSLSLTHIACHLYSHGCLSKSILSKSVPSRAQLVTQLCEDGRGRRVRGHSHNPYHTSHEPQGSQPQIFWLPTSVLALSRTERHT